MKLREICGLAVDALSEEGVDSYPTIDELMADLAVLRGPVPFHYLHVGMYYPEQGKPRPVDGEMDIDAEFMAMQETPHFPSVELTFHDSERQLIDALLGSAGVFNHFTGWVIAFVRGRARKFRCSYVGIDGVRKVFNKREQQSEVNFGQTYPEPRLHWIEESP